MGEFYKYRMEGKVIFNLDNSNRATQQQRPEQPERSNLKINSLGMARTMQKWHTATRTVAVYKEWDQKDWDISADSLRMTAYCPSPGW